MLLAGATGFIGRHAFPALQAAGCEVVCASRHPAAAAARHPERNWVRLDMEEPATLAPAMAGCRAVLYLVHQMDRPGYSPREAQAATWLCEAAAAAGVERIVYLGGVAPTGPVSVHLQSRLATGQALRAGNVPAIELRAGMIIGHGSASWQIVRDLAARLPAMVLPRWLCNRSSPVAVDDVVAALLWALSEAPARAAWFDVPGPEVVSHRELLVRVAALLGKHPAMLEVPVVTPELSAYWIALVTRTSLSLARELVCGLQSDLVPRGPSPWAELGREPLRLDVAARQALRDEVEAGGGGADLAQAVDQRLRELGAHLATGCWV